MADKDVAIQNLIALVRQNPSDVGAWLALAHLVDEPNKKADCYRQVLRYAPDNEQAEEYLAGAARMSRNELSQGDSTGVDQRAAPTRRTSGKKGGSQFLTPIWGAAGVLGIVCFGLGGVVLWNAMKPSAGPLPSPILAPTLARHYTVANVYLPDSSEMPTGFLIKPEAEISFVITNDAKTQQIGTFASRTFVNPVYEPNKIVAVLYAIRVSEDLNEARSDYQSTTAKYTSPRTVKGDFDEAAYEIAFDDASVGLTHLDQTIRRANAVITVRCQWILDQSADKEMLVQWAHFYVELGLAQFG